MDPLKELQKCGQVDRQILSIGEHQTLVDGRLKSWKEAGFNRRLWEKDPTLWFKDPVPEITDRLGWLNLPEIMHEQLEDLVSFAEEVKEEGIRNVILLGMGGSSLASEVYQKTFGNKTGYPKLTVLDSTHPDAVRAIEEKIDLMHALFIVASKTGVTLEPLAFFKYFWEKMGQVDYDTGRHFIAVTDPGSSLVELAREKGFRRIFLAPPDLGGRYSALTVFGLVPAALMGMDVHKLLDRAGIAAKGCAFCIAEPKNPCLALGAALGELAKRGIDKVTFVTSPSLESFPNWLEQLIAESLGKDGKGIVPIVGERLSSSNVYGRDRFFVYFYLEGDKDLEHRLKKIEAMGHPVVRIRLTEKYDVGLEIFRWEVAIAAAGVVMGIHPFNQPDVELAKNLARQAMKKDAETGADGVETLPIDSKELPGAFENWVSQAKKGDYVAIQAYLSPTEETNESINKLRLGLLKKLGIATTVGFGPRFLHSTGQLHKGGANNGLFLQLVDEPSEDLFVPGVDYSFGDIIRAQALGDFQALKKRGQRVLRVNLKKDVSIGISKIIELLNNQNNGG